MPSGKIYCLVLFQALFFVGEARARKLLAQSGPGRVSLVELYSSESCSSCPPAEEWVAELKSNTGLWKDFVPVVFHVDYWNDLGWVDGLSSHSMTKRQQSEAQAWAHPSVYTPAVVVNGKEWKAWGHARIPEGEGSAPTLSVHDEGEGNFSVSAKTLRRGHHYRVFFARLGMGVTTDVKGGENKGRRLRHDFAVLDWENQALRPDKTRAAFHFAARKIGESLAFAAWIEEDGKPAALQATGGYLSAP